MTWKELKNGEWKATGKEGEFWLWKSGRQWTGCYKSRDGKKCFHLPYKSLREMKALCKENSYWEEAV